MYRNKLKAAILLLLLFFHHPSAANSKKSRAVPPVQLSNPWYVQGAERVQSIKKWVKKRSKAKNVILFVGDGMGVSTVTAARILDGQLKGVLGEENNLSFDEFPFTALSKTYTVDAQIPDSAGTMTAMMTGVKTDAGVIGVDEDVTRGECETAQGNQLTTALELAELAGKSTGIVSTARITHATPAATYAKSADRNWEDISKMSPEAIKAGCEDIASQLIAFESKFSKRYPKAKTINGLEVILGGGRRHFLPAAVSTEGDSNGEIPAMVGLRTDGRHLVAEWQAIYPDGLYVQDKIALNGVDADQVDHLFGLFSSSHMRYVADTQQIPSAEPSLTQMTLKAIDVLDNNKKGYFLMVESGRIDHGHHAGSAYKALHETIEFSKAVQAAVDTADEDTLILVTADHSHVFTIAGYPKRGNPILGKVVTIGQQQPVLAKDGLPYTTLGYANGLGFKFSQDYADLNVPTPVIRSAGRQDLTEVDTQSPHYHQEALVPLKSETHGGEDVVIYARGPGAQWVAGTLEQNVIFHIMDQAAQLVKKASKKVR